MTNRMTRHSAGEIQLIFNTNTMMTDLMKIFICVLFGAAAFSCSDNGYFGDEKELKTGAEMLIIHHLDDLERKRVGLVLNPTARIGEVHMLDTLTALDVNITALFAPEHGFR